MIIAWKQLGLAFGLLSVSISVHGKESMNHSLRGGDDTSRQLTGGGTGTVTVDFDDVPASQFVSNQYLNYGLRLSSSGGFGQLPRIFDTRNPVTGQYGDPDLGSPNEHCPGGGPGKGAGGVPSAPGKNCDPLGNVLIIQEYNKEAMDIPDDNADGGKIYFDFNPPAKFVEKMAFLDNDYGGKLIVEHGNNQKTIFNLPTLGDNAYEYIGINLSDVTRITFESVRSGAVVFIRFSPGSIDIPETVEPEVIEIPYNIISVVAADTCFDPTSWCEDKLFDLLTGALVKYNLTPEEFDAFLNGLQALYCDAASSAVSAAGAVVSGDGVFKLTRGGCCGGTVDEISLTVGLDAATLALADVAAYARAYADAFAYAFAKEKDCSKIEAGSLRARLCALAKGQADSQAIASGYAEASATAVGSAGVSTDVSIEVEARKINLFRALISTSISSFAAANASATADAFAAAYAAALAKIKITSEIQKYHRCRNKKRHCSKICHYGKCKCYWYSECMGECGWWTTVHSDKFKKIAEDEASDVESSFATAFASALAAIDVKMNIPAYFEDRQGEPDKVMFGSEEDVQIDVAVQCLA